MRVNEPIIYVREVNDAVLCKPLKCKTNIRIVEGSSKAVSISVTFVGWNKGTRIGTGSSVIISPTDHFGNYPTVRYNCYIITATFDISIIGPPDLYLETPMDDTSVAPNESIFPMIRESGFCLPFNYRGLYFPTTNLRGNRFVCPIVSNTIRIQYAYRGINPNEWVMKGGTRLYSQGDHFIGLPIDRGNKLHLRSRTGTRLSTLVFNINLESSSNQGIGVEIK